MHQSAKIVEEQDSRPGALRSGLGSVFSRMRWTLWKTGAAMLVGGALPLLLGDGLPQTYEATTRLKVEAASEDAVEGALKALRSKQVLDNLIRALNLRDDSEFEMDRPSVVRVVSDIVSGSEMTVSQAENRLRERLSQALTVGYDQGTKQVVISASAADAGEAAKIANMLGDTFRGELAVAGAATSEPVVEKLRQTLERAEAALAGFAEETGGQKLAELRRSQNEQKQLVAEVAEVQAELADLKIRAARASAMTLEDVLNKPLPDNLDYTGLEYQRQRHVEAKLAVDQLSGNLGPRHPRLLAAQAALQEVRLDIQKALKQLSSTLRQQETAAGRHLAELKNKQSRKPDDKEIAESAARLAALEDAAKEARQNYLDALHRSEGQAALPATRVEILSPATAEAAQPAGLSMMQASAAGAVAGLCFGLALSGLTRRSSGSDEMDEEPAFDFAVEPEPAHRELEAVDLVETLEDEDDADYNEPHRDLPAFRRKTRYAAPANDVPLAEQIREMLIANRRPSREIDLPPLVAAVMSGGSAHPPSYSAARSSPEDIRKAEEVRELRRNMTELRERVQSYSARRGSTR